MGAPPYLAMTIAKWFISWAQAEDGDELLSNMKLQKLLYYAQGHHLAKRDAPLFGEEVQAWSHGPVVPPIYRSFRDFGARGIELPADDSFSWEDVDPDTAQFLSMIWNTYGGYSAGRLRAMTHDEWPWRDAFARGERDTAIPEPDMTTYFRQFEPEG